MLYGGRIAEIGRVKDVVKNHRHPYTHKLIKAFPDIKGERNMVQSIPGFPLDLLAPSPGCRFSPRCEYANDRCRNEEPPVYCAAPQHFVACHRLEA
ncbi:MAG TPA: oligopeptide/dipeptide ABC transporter ATP-binding protein [Negativicutes bacterium]|nr:oligopeptide/dipeptide ABC transporter ATP-binding protein [Negativicutes bacterium]